MYHSTSVFPEKIEVKVEPKDYHHPVIVKLADEEDSTDVVIVFLTKEQAKELFLELELALGEFQQKEKMVEMNEADPSLV